MGWRLLNQRDNQAYQWKYVFLVSLLFKELVGEERGCLFLRGACLIFWGRG